MMTRTPPLIKPHVVQICRQATGSGTAMPVYVQCRPEIGGRENECFATVDARVTAEGGEKVIGWAIWELKKVYIEAEFHAVWRQPDGVLLDISPRPIPDTQILFVVDPRRKDEGFQVDNVRRSLGKDPDIQRWLDLTAQYYRLLNEGDLKHQMGVIPTTPAIREVQHQIEIVLLKLIRRYPGIGG